MAIVQMKQHSLLISIFEKYQTDILRFVSAKFGNHHDAEDVVQDTFQNVLQCKKISDIDNPVAYIYKTANNLALNRIRSQKQHSKYLSSIESDEPIDEFERSIIARSELEQVQRALEQLPVKYRKTFEMSRVEHKTYAQISDELGISISTVEKHIIKVLFFLRQHLQEGSTK